MKIIVVTGSTGGHVFPALSFLEALKEKNRDVDALLVLPEKIKKSQIIPKGHRIHYIPISAIKLSLGLKNLLAIARFFEGFWDSFWIILKFNPDVVVGFGSLVSVPVVLWAWLMRIRTVIHEQNVIPGRATRLLAKFSDKIAVSFEETKEYLGASEKRVVLTGNPLRKELKRYDKNEALAFLGLDPVKFTILVMGGSQGSRKINNEFLKTMSNISDASRFQIIHLAGRNDYEVLRDGYKNINVKVKLFDFCNDMQYVYSASDLVICRAGATTVSEIIFFGLPAIIVPYPYAYRHQNANTKILEARGAALVIQDNQLNAEIIKEKIKSLSENSDTLNQMRDAFNSFAQFDASEALARQCI